VEIKSLKDKKVVQVGGGGHHSAAVTENGEIYMWGRLDSGQLGLDNNNIEEENIARDAHGRARSLKIPMLISDEKFSRIECGSSHNLAIHKKDQSVWSWGFGEMYQTGHGPPARDTPFPTKIENSAVRDVKIVELGCGAQFSVIGGVPPPTTNGVNGHKE
jgi:regulator of chromosome condensation